MSAAAELPWTLGASALQLLALAVVRWIAVLRVQPLLRLGFGVSAWAIAIVLALVLALHDLAVAPALALRSGGELVLALVAEAVLGTVFGHGIALSAHAVVGAGATTAAVLRAPSAPLVGLFVALVLAAALTLGLHHGALHGAVALARAWPLGEPAAWIPDAATALPWLVASATGALVLALAFATPCLLSAAASELVIAAVARGPEGAAALAQAIAPTARLAVVLVALGASWAIDLPRWAAAALPLR
jgi:hypothetical protein